MIADPGAATLLTRDFALHEAISTPRSVPLKRDYSPVRSVRGRVAETEEHKNIEA